MPLLLALSPLDLLAKLVEAALHVRRDVVRCLLCGAARVLILGHGENVARRIPSRQRGKGGHQRAWPGLGCLISATVVGVLVLAQLPSLAETIGVALVIAGVALHRAS